MDLQALRNEFIGRGFDFLDEENRAEVFINRSYQELCAEEDWPFLEATATGTAPLTIADLATIESVWDSTLSTLLRPIDRRNIQDTEDDLTTTGTPLYYYTTTLTTVNVFPVNTSSTISVRYWKAPEDLAVDADEPLIPARFHNVIVDGAVAYAYYDSDNFEAGSASFELWLQGKARMRDLLLNQQHDRTDDYIRVISGSEDWG